MEQSTISLKTISKEYILNCDKKLISHFKKYCQNANMQTAEMSDVHLWCAFPVPA